MSTHVCVCVCMWCVYKHLNTCCFVAYFHQNNERPVMIMNSHVSSVKWTGKQRCHPWWYLWVKSVRGTKSSDHITSAHDRPFSAIPRNSVTRMCLAPPRQIPLWYRPRLKLRVTITLTTPVKGLILDFPKMRQNHFVNEIWNLQLHALQRHK